MSDRFSDIIDTSGEISNKKEISSNLSLEEVLRFMIANQFESIHIEGYIERYDKTLAIVHRVRRFKNGIPNKEKE